MPRGYRYFVVAAFGIALSQWEVEAKTDQAKPDGHHQYTQPAENASRAADNEEKARRYQNPCGYQSSRDDSDLCAQWTSARAAVASNAWSKPNFIVALIQAIGLVVSLILSAIAAIAAWRAERSATRAAELYKTTDRAWLGHFQTNITKLADPATRSVTHIRLTFAFKNTGRSPALRVATTIDARSLSIETDVDSFVFDEIVPRDNRTTVVFPDGTIGTGHLDIPVFQCIDIVHGREIFIARVTAHYRDIYTQNLHSTEVTYQLGRGAGDESFTNLDDEPRLFSFSTVTQHQDAT